DFHPCDLLMLQNVTPAHKGLAPSRLINYLSVVKRCPCWAHTMYKNNSGISSKFKVSESKKNLYLTKK
ncbi:hypothetical protein, partial [Tenacibaculum finnmarkense]|uniref:hypothetical protein n=1 Tax=Tenacibaculum finnmarkense TaxID=2781243 RepID=UPI001EFA9CD7